MVPYNLRPGLLHFRLPFTRRQKHHRPARNIRRAATSIFPTRKLLIILTIDSSRNYLGNYSPSPLSSLCFLATHLASLNSLIQLLSLLLDTTRHSQHYQTSRTEPIVLGSLHNYSKLLKLHHTTTNMLAQRPSQLPPCPGPPPSRPLPPLPK
ncbi:hypothetical protein EDB81DRAFT_312700 [Dactylonectria macrodidyma]|uniref:Uncharacterized protein n=1 Tax=Dactylonectria macrodidyma TaxID=307937 RepID=A0A9P9IAM4_9HYPO|nr:hypothetical protein EDB81DRAFT_312700 [Dactylonectria macrodidyma]